MMPVPARRRATAAISRGLLLARYPAYSTVVGLAPRRSQHFSSGYSTVYDPANETARGPIFSKAGFGVPQFYPRDLKRRVDDYVVGQDRAKKTICAVIFNHYQGLRRRQQHEAQDQRLREKLQRQRYAQDRDLLQERAGYGGGGQMHPSEGARWSFDNFQKSRRRTDDERYAPEDEYPGYSDPVRAAHELPDVPPPNTAEELFLREEASAAPPHVKIDKSNLLLIGPTGVGKTYILETLSKKINVPFTISDCNAFTQAGYIGQDVESCVERLLIDANYDIKAAEHGIIVLDEFDKIARKETVNGRDVGGEGVQQALLKLIEGTKVTIQVKDQRSSRGSPASPSSSNYNSTPSSAPPSGKSDQYVVDTTNILFVFCGAFVGLDKTVLRRVSKPSMGFGSEIRGGRNASLSGGQNILPPDMYKHLPHQPAFPLADPEAEARSLGFTPLDLTTPQDLQAFGFIPELIGRLHNICALTPLSLDELFRILTEPRNSLVAQYTALFETYPSHLSFSQRALRAIAERAARNETGARGLKMEMERVLAEPMFDAPMPYVLITEACVHGTEKPGYWGKDGRQELINRLEEEDADKGEDTGFEQPRVAGQGSG